MNWTLAAWIIRKHWQNIFESLHSSACTSTCSCDAVSCMVQSTLNLTVGLAVLEGECIIYKVVEMIATNRADYRLRLTVKIEKCFQCDTSIQSQSFLLDPSFLNSFLPLEKKPFFFLPWAAQSVFVGLSVGRGVGAELQASTVAGPGAGGEAGSRSDMGLAARLVSLGFGSVCSCGSGIGGSVWGGEGSSSVEGTWSCGFVEDVQVSFKKRERL